MKEDKEKLLDFAQLVVNTVCMIPVVGKPTNIVNAGGSLDRKDRIRSVAISMLGAISIVDDVSNRVSKGKRMRDPTKTLSEEFEAFLEDLPKGIYKKTITGASRKVISPERLAEMMQEKIKMLEFESARGCLSNTCFPGGTPILTQTGPIPIEQIKVGMLVNTQNPETGESGDQAVLSVSQTHVRKLFHIHVGKTEIKSTAMHRLYVQEKGFIPAQDLKVGDRLLGLKEGIPETFPIDQVAVQFYETPVIVYNFEVAAWHTYRVGEIGILVHNGKKTCSGKIPEPKKDENLILDLLGYYDAKQVITDIARGEVDLDTLKAGASLIPVAKITKVPKVVKAIGNVGKSGFKKGKEGEKIAKSSQAKQTKAKNKGGSGSKPGKVNGRDLNSSLLNELANSGVKCNINDVIKITKTADGKLVWLENGNSKAGLEHIIQHADQFAAKGISSDKIPDFIMHAIKDGKVVGTQRTRPIYEVMYEGKLQRVAISISNNGFIVGANPKSIPK